MDDIDNSRDWPIVRYSGEHSEPLCDQVAHEEPLEIQVQGASLAVVMRTPGHDAELALGFLVTEGVVRSMRDIRSVRHCDRVASPEAEDNVMRVLLADGVELDLARLQRNLFASSSCGVCGKASIDNLLVQTPPLEDTLRVAPSVLYALPGALRKHQAGFTQTGGLHAVGLADASGHLQVVREDVGRHNAVDKVVGWALRHDAVPLRGRVLVVSGRVSFEVVQKAAVAGIAMICAISAPTSLAVQLAQSLGVTLVCFVRGETLNVYTHTGRVR